MRLRVAVVALLACAAAVVWCMGPSHADACPVRIVEVYVLQQGRAHQADRYVLRMFADGAQSGTATVTLMPGAQTLTLDGTWHGDPGASLLQTYLVTMPHVPVEYALLTTWQRKSGSSIPCDDAPKAMLGTPSGVPTPAAFDDRAETVAGPQVIRVNEPVVKNRITPVYPATDAYSCHEGVAHVIVVVGPTGDVVSSRIETSTGYDGLDQSAAVAAEQSTYSPASVPDGTPLTLDELVIYDFLLPKDFQTKAGIHCKEQ